MGWSSGSALADEIWDTVGIYIPKEEKKRIANHILKLFENQDADDFDYDMQIMKDAERKEDDDN
jgi:hypothetical protein